MPLTARLRDELVEVWQDNSGDVGGTEPLVNAHSEPGTTAWTRTRSRYTLGPMVAVHVRLYPAVNFQLDLISDYLDSSSGIGSRRGTRDR